MGAGVGEGHRARARARVRETTNLSDETCGAERDPVEPLPSIVTVTGGSASLCVHRWGGG